VAIESISVFTIQPGRRGEFVDLFESLVDQHMPSVRAAGCSSVTLYNVIDDADKASRSSGPETVAGTFVNGNMFHGSVRQ
jgi:hypothetical protein